MTSTAGFNDGIEAAAQWMDELARQQATITGMAEDAHNSRTIAQNIRALKRPEPSDPAFKGLKPCPFCGESMCFTWVGNAADSAEAMEAPMCACGAQGPMYPTRTDAIAAWNMRPEPSEGERVEKVAAVIERELMTDEMLLADPATLRKIKSQRIARAALAAMRENGR